MFINISIQQPPIHLTPNPYDNLESDFLAKELKFKSFLTLNEKINVSIRGVKKDTSKSLAIKIVKNAARTAK